MIEKLEDSDSSVQLIHWKEDNPFIQEDQNPALLDTDSKNRPDELSHAGLSTIWRRCCYLFPEIVFLKHKLPPRKAAPVQELPKHSPEIVRPNAPAASPTPKKHVLKRSKAGIAMIVSTRPSSVSVSPRKPPVQKFRPPAPPVIVRPRMAIPLPEYVPLPILPRFS